MLRKIVGFGETLAQALIAFGIFGLCQPWWLALYERGFLLLLLGTGLFIIVTHIPTRSPEASA